MGYEKFNIKELYILISQKMKLSFSNFYIICEYYLFLTSDYSSSIGRSIIIFYLRTKRNKSIY